MKLIWILLLITVGVAAAEDTTIALQIQAGSYTVFQIDRDSATGCPPTNMTSNPNTGTLRVHTNSTLANCGMESFVGRWNTTFLQGATIKSARVKFRVGNGTGSFSNTACNLAGDWSPANNSGTFQNINNRGYTTGTAFPKQTNTSYPANTDFWFDLSNPSSNINTSGETAIRIGMSCSGVTTLGIWFVYIDRLQTELEITYEGGATIRRQVIVAN